MKEPHTQSYTCRQSVGHDVNCKTSTCSTGLVCVMQWQFLKGILQRPLWEVRTVDTMLHWVIRGGRRGKCNRGGRRPHSTQPPSQSLPLCLPVPQGSAADHSRYEECAAWGPTRSAVAGRIGRDANESRDTPAYLRVYVRTSLALELVTLVGLVEVMLFIVLQWYPPIVQ